MVRRDGYHKLARGMEWEEVIAGREFREKKASVVRVFV